MSNPSSNVAAGVRHQLLPVPEHKTTNPAQIPSIEEAPADYAPEIAEDLERVESTVQQEIDLRKQQEFADRRDKAKYD